jgi:hypothetical protein
MFGVDAQADARAPTGAICDRVEQLELADALDVEAAHVHRERALHLGARLADAGKDDPRRIAASGEDALEFAAGNDVEAAAAPREPLQHGQRRVGLDGVAEQVIAAGQRVLVGGEGARHCSGRVGVERRFEAAREIDGGDAFDHQSVIAKRDVGCAGQVHQRDAGADAGDAAGARPFDDDTGGEADGAALGRASGPFWPHAAKDAEMAARAIAPAAVATTLPARPVIRRFYRP